MMRSKIAITELIIFLWILLAGCSTLSAQISKAVPNTLSAQVTKAVPEERALKSEILDLRNCASNEDLHSNLASEAPIKMQVALAEEATSTTGDTILIPTELKEKLTTQIELAYQQAYEEAFSNAERIELDVPAHMIYMYDIKWTEQIFSSTVSFPMEGQDCIASYTYTLEIPELDSFTVMACTA